ncbi:MAG: iron export ABC transporter permease subunit FetB [Sphingomonadales bacterium]
MTGYIELSYFDLVLAAGFLIASAALSLVLQLRLERQLLLAATRMVVQLGLIGLVLKALFAAVSPWLTGGVAVAMALLAGREIMARQQQRLSGWWAYGLGASTMLIAGAIVTVLALTTQLQPEPWHHPRYAIPLFGMILGNTMTGISLGLNTLTTAVGRDRMAVEARLTLGATRWQALRPVSRDALRNGFMPIVNSMAAAGLVFLPGMMTGQILAGVEPTEAAKYQILIILLIAGATGIGVLTAVMGAVWRLTDERHRLRLDRLSRPRKSNA